MLWPLCTGGWSCGLRCIRNECHKWSPRLWHKNACLTTDGLVYRHWPDLQTMTLIHHWWTGPQSLTQPTNSDTRLTTDGLVHSHWPDLQTVTLGWPLMDWFTVTDLTYKQWHSADHWWTDSQLLTRPTNSDTQLTTDGLVHSHWPDLQTQEHSADHWQTGSHSLTRLLFSKFSRSRKLLILDFNNRIPTTTSVILISVTSTL